MGGAPGMRLQVVDGGEPGGDRPGHGAAAQSRRLTPRGAISRDRIIAATLELLAEGGYSALSITAICKRAQVSAASLYHYFGDKAGLIAAALDHALTEGARRYTELVCSKERPLDQFDAFIEATRELGRDRVNDPVGALAAIAEATSDAPELIDIIVAARARAWGTVAAEIAEHFGIEDAALLTHLHYAFTTYMAHVVRTSQSTDEARLLFESFRRVLLITFAAVCPRVLDDPDFAAAVAHAGRSSCAAPPTSPEAQP